MAKKYVPDGACLVCNKGLGFGKLKVTNHKNVSIYGEKSATEGDKVTGLNIPSLGICSVTRAACQPVPTKWSGVQEKITIGPYRKLLEDSKLGCGIGGQISVYFSIPSAMLAVKNNMKENAGLQAKKLGAKVDDWFKKQFDDAEKRNNVMPDGKARNFGLGVVEGIYGGVKGIGEGLLFLKKMQDKAMDVSLHAITHPVETAGQIKDAAVATKDATVKAAEWVSNTDNLKNTAASIGEAHVKAYNWVTTSGNVQKAATSAYNGSVEKLKEAKEWAGKQSPRDWGNYTGRGAFEVGLMATGVGEAKAVVEGANVASKVGEGANVAGKLGEGANVVSKTAEAANVGEKAAEGANVLDKAVEGKRLGEVVSETENVYHMKSNDYVQSVVDEINPKFFNEENRYQDGFYIAEKGETAIAEVVYHGADATKAKIIRFELDKSKLKVLDLTDKKIANDWGLADAKKFEINALKPGNESINKYQKFQEISIKAREEGFNAIKFESARGTGSNYVIYGKETSFFKEILKPQMVMPAN